MSPTALQLVVVSIYAAGLSAVGIWHILSGDTTERLFHDPRRVRLVGALMLLMALPCLAWLDRGYFVAMLVVLGGSGAMRFFTPQLNIRVQQRLYPRWVHGWIMTLGGIVTWMAYRWLVR